MLTAALSLLGGCGVALGFQFYVLAHGDYLYEPNPIIAWVEFGLSVALVVYVVMLIIILDKRGLGRYNHRVRGSNNADKQ